MKVILLSLMIVCFFGYHANACYCGGDTSACCYFKGLVCQGFAEIRSEFNGTETVHGRINKPEDQDIQLEEGSSMDVEFENEKDWMGYTLDYAKKASKLKYRPTGGRNARKIIEVEGNCCWKFYRR